MGSRKSSKIPYILIVVLGAAIAGLLLYMVPYRYRLNQTVTFSQSNDPLDNPLTGYAPDAANTEECSDSQLVYIGLTWRDWEPSAGQYDIQGLEEKFHIQEWKQDNKHAVLRFICDIPGEEGHKDIPEWLYEQTRDGEFYQTEYGAGYSPNYGNEYFRERHSLALEALAEYCNQDDFVAYVELGSLGHWGEWHTNTDAGLEPLPDAEICWAYVLDYSDNFYNARLLMRRNFVMAQEGNLGLYNDMTGSEPDTREWLDWIRDGGSYETSGSELLYSPMEDFWQEAPSGGVFCGGAVGRTDGGDAGSGKGVPYDVHRSQLSGRGDKGFGSGGNAEGTFGISVLHIQHEYAVFLCQQQSGGGDDLGECGDCAFILGLAGNNVCVQQ